MKPLRKLAFALVLAALALGLGLGCGATFDPPTEIKTLRVLGVSKDKPYAEPGDVVNFSLLWYDGTRPIILPEAAAGTSGVSDESGGGQGGAGGPSGAGGDGEPLGAAGLGASGEAGTQPSKGQRQVKLTWLGGCINPPADGYSGCFAEYAQALAAGAVLPVDGIEPADRPAGVITVGTGSHFSVTIPTDAELGKRGPLLHPSQDPRLPDYGLSYVFFALCAGDLVPGDEHFPVHCQDAAGHDLGPDDFVLGYSAIYFFAHGPSGKPYTNANPVTTGLKFGWGDVTGVTCFGDDCLGTCKNGVCENHPPEPINKTYYPTLYLKACKDDGDPQKCPATNLRLDIDPTTFEPDQVTNDAYGRAFGEQMWIDYYSTRGRFRAATKLLNDATRGYNHVNGTQFYAPKEPGPVDLWIVLHDNRGGVSWAGTTLMIE